MHFGSRTGYCLKMFDTSAKMIQNFGTNTQDCITNQAKGATFSQAS